MSTIADGTVSGCKNYGKISLVVTDDGRFTSQGVAGVVAYSLDNLSECENYGPISFTQDRAGFVGGIAGMLESGTISFDTCINQAEGSISFESSKRSFVGGVIGGARSANVEDVTVSACKNHAAITNIKGASDIGGITGQIWTSNASAVNIVISNCENTGTISSTCAENAGGNTSNLNIGGIFGQLDPDANCCRSSVSRQMGGARRYRRRRRQSPYREGLRERRRYHFILGWRSSQTAALCRRDYGQLQHQQRSPLYHT